MNEREKQIKDQKYQQIEDDTTQCIKCVSLVLDFGSITDQEKDLLLEALKKAVRARARNRVLWEHNQ
jgi:hypothetical protein